MDKYISQSWNKVIKTIRINKQKKWLYSNFEGQIVSKIKQNCKFYIEKERLTILSLLNKEFNYQPSNADFKGVF